MTGELYQRLREYFNALPEPTEEEKKFAIELNSGYFPIKSIQRDDLDSIGFDVKKIDDDNMLELARKMADDYRGQLFWSSLEIIAEHLGFPKQRGRFCPKCGSKHIHPDLTDNLYQCESCKQTWDDKLYVLVEFPEDASCFEEEDTGYPSWESEDNGARYVPEYDYIAVFGASPERDNCYRILCWPDSQPYMDKEGCELVQDGKALEDFGSSAYWVPLSLLEIEKRILICPECGSTDIDILADEKAAVCNKCHLEWPYGED